MPLFHRRTDAAETVRPRPAWLRALGRDEPPHIVTVAGRTYHRVDVFKHDSWAATALYECADADAPVPRITCKFNRRQSVLGVPCRWIGRRLARREADFLRRLGDLPGIPREMGPVVVEGVIADTAAARQFVSGHPLGHRERVGDGFFAELQTLLTAVHARDVAYVDLHKRENVLVGDDGRPHLIDFQVSFGVQPGSWSLLPRRRVLSILQRMDLYHCVKLHRKCRPDQCGLSAAELADARPRLVRLHRLIAQPLRTLRRKLLTAIGVRKTGGRASSESFAEAALRQ